MVSNVTIRLCNVGDHCVICFYFINNTAIVFPLLRKLCSLLWSKEYTCLYHFSTLVWLFFIRRICSCCCLSSWNARLPIGSWGRIWNLLICLKTKLMIEAKLCFGSSFMSYKLGLYIILHYILWFFLSAGSKKTYESGTQHYVTWVGNQMEV